MSKHKSPGKDKKKGSQLVIRVDTAERDTFVQLCDRLDTSAAREIRRFMRELVAAHSGADPAPSKETVRTGETDRAIAPSEVAAMAKALVKLETPAARTVKPRQKPVPQ